MANFFKRMSGRCPVISHLRLEGPIYASGSQSRRGLSLARLDRQIKRAFQPRRLDGVALSINSPGGSAVQSNLIYSRIRELAEEKNVKVYSFVEDIGVSGGYWLAIAGDEIYVDPSSVVGSIGVISSTIGLDKFIKKRDIDHRVFTAGEKKAFIHPLSPVDPEREKKLTQVLEGIHENFKDAVRNRRGTKLNGNEAAVFSGDFFLGSEAIDLGLADGVGSAHSILREKFGKDFHLQQIRGYGWLSSVGSCASVGDIGTIAATMQGSSGAPSGEVLGDAMWQAMEHAMDNETLARYGVRHR